MWGGKATDLALWQGGGVVRPERLREEMRKVKQLTNKPFGVDILAHDPRMPALIDVVIEEGGWTRRGLDVC